MKCALKQMQELDMHQKILAGTPFENKAILDALGPLAEGVIYPYHFIANITNPMISTYLEAFQKRFETHSGGFAPLMYDGVHIIAEALKKCEENTDCIATHLYQTSYQGISGTMTFDKNGDPNLPIVMKTVHNGQFVQAE